MGTGGMRIGAGRPGWHVKAEGCRQLDARRWARERILQAMCSGVWAWTDAATGERLASIGYRSDGRTAVALDFNINGEAMHQQVPILTTECNYGGRRYWFGCPRCGARVAILYLRNLGFGCRRCCRVAYASQSEDDLGRTWRRQSKIERRLGDDWQRAKGMHRTTYEQLLQVVYDCEEKRDAGLLRYMARLGLAL